ncbi:unnamed protein product [Notodromas monacha]|uniref:Isopropylmalate dehydrogenase-like domain-containing protein n=1 Tax=Notodromas monacha TaxID=399045 RepID=A0A7R9BDL8_9CRUS|nr:unnamed protein product [Notodromas monacha]CAG0912301.1 unnamed protein product [Notodromas monacha]
MNSSRLLFQNVTHSWRCGLGTLTGRSSVLEPSASFSTGTSARSVASPATAPELNPEYPIARYGGRHAVTMLPGAGIGPEMMKHVRDIFHFTGIPVDFEVVDTDPTMVDAKQMDSIITSVKRNGVAIKGNIEAKFPLPGQISRNVMIRNELDLFMNTIHAKSWPAISNRFPNIDILIVRQNLEGEYSMKEHENVPGVIESLKIITRPNSERLARFAYRYAINDQRRKKKMVTQFDVMLMPNLYGTIITNVVCGLIGGAGLISGCNYSSRGVSFFFFE